MYIPRHFDESRPAVLHELIRRHPLAALVTPTADGLVANHVPLLLDAAGGPLGVLHGHVARANPVWSTAQPEAEALAIFQGPQAYISPNWYATKRETGRAVPTWNYAVAHAHGRLRVIDDPDWLRGQVERLTASQEGDGPGAWAVSDAPAGYVDGMLAGIVGIELVVTRLEGKWKMSQNQPAANQEGVVAGLRAVGSPDAGRVADLVERQSRHADGDE